MRTVRDVRVGIESDKERRQLLTAMANEERQQQEQTLLTDEINAYLAKYTAVMAENLALKNELADLRARLGIDQRLAITQNGHQTAW